MFYAVHAIVGYLIAGYFSSILLIIILALASHFILDIIPHWDGFYDKTFFEATGYVKNMGRKMIFAEILDLLITLFIVIYFIIFTPESNKMILIGVIASLSPDIIKIGYFTPLKKNSLFIKYLDFHSRIQREVGWKCGIFIQLIIVIVLFLILQ